MPLCCWVAALAGCGPSADIHLFQPGLAGRQRDLRLTSEQVYWTTGNGAERILAEFPLPGAATGRPMYLLYLRWPAGARELTAAGESAAGVRGFLIQTRDRYAGKASVVAGKVVVSGTSQSGKAPRRLDVELTCEDGTRVVGHLLAWRDDYYLSCFETHRRPADVQALSHPTAASDAEG